MYSVIKDLHRIYKKNESPIKVKLNGSDIKKMSTNIVSKDILIKKIENKYTNSDYKIKLIVANVLNRSENTDIIKNGDTLKFMLGVSFSFYLVYSFIKRYRT